jgi:hypothetical protein
VWGGGGAGSIGSVTASNGFPDSPAQRRADLLAALRGGFRLDRPVPPTRASRTLRALIVLTAVTVVVVEAVNVLAADEPGFSLFVRSTWALLRVIGFLFLMRAVRYGRQAARSFGLILSITTVFAVARLAEPRAGSLVPPASVIVGFLVLALLGGAVVWMLYQSSAIDEHLSNRPVRRHIPGWVLTARMAVLSYSALTLIPVLVACGTVFSDDRRLSLAATLPLLGGGFLLVFVLLMVSPFSSFLVVVGKAWARVLVGMLGVIVLIFQPLLCYLLLGLDGLIRDGAPLIVTAVLGLVALHRSRGLPTWVRPNAGSPNNGSPNTGTTPRPRESPVVS